MRRQALEPVSLMAGLAFVGIGLVFLLGDADLATRVRWTWPILLVSAGIAVLARLLLPKDVAPKDVAPAEQEHQPDPP